MLQCETPSESSGLTTTTRLQPNFGTGPIISQENVTARNSPHISQPLSVGENCNLVSGSPGKQQEGKADRWLCDDGAVAPCVSNSTGDYNVFLTTPCFHEDNH